MKCGGVTGRFGTWASTDRTPLLYEDLLIMKVGRFGSITTWGSAYLPLRWHLLR